MLAEQEAEANKLQSECPVSAALHREYHKVKAIHLKNGEEPRDAKVKAWMTLANSWQDQGGIDFYIVAMKIPTAEGIYDEIEVINTMKAHPQLCSMNRKDRCGCGHAYQWAALAWIGGLTHAKMQVMWINNQFRADKQRKAHAGGNGHRQIACQG